MSGIVLNELWMVMPVTGKVVSAPQPDMHKRSVSQQTTTPLICGVSALQKCIALMGGMSILAGLGAIRYR